MSKYKCEKCNHEGKEMDIMEYINISVMILRVSFANYVAFSGGFFVEKLTFVETCQGIEVDRFSVVGQEQWDGLYDGSCDIINNEVICNG